MYLPRNTQNLDNARKLRREMTPQERHLWYDFLRTYPIKIYRQKIIGGYIVDFYCDAAKTVIELDGSQHYEESGLVYDEARSAYLKKLGLVVVRYLNQDITNNFSGVCENIDRVIKARMGAGEEEE